MEIPSDDRRLEIIGNSFFDYLSLKLRPVVDLTVHSSIRILSMVVGAVCFLIMDLLAHSRVDNLEYLGTFYVSQSPRISANVVMSPASVSILLFRV